MDSIVQDLVFGHKGRARASTVSSKEVTGSWLKDRRLLGFLKNGKGGRNGSGSHRSNGVDGRGIGGGGGNGSEASTPTTRYDSNSSAHSVRMRSVGLKFSLYLPLWVGSFPSGMTRLV